MVPNHLAPPTCCPLCTRPIAVCQCGTTPAHDDLQALPKPTSRFVKRGAYYVCLTCGFTSMYCRCANQPIADVPPEDGAESSLAQRILDVRFR